MNFNYLFICILATLFLIGCDSEIDKTKIKTVDSKIDSINYSKATFDKKMAEKPKIFLKFWEDMTWEEYQKVIKIMVQENILFGTEKGMPSSESPYKEYKYYDEVNFKVSEDCFVKFSGNFEENKLKSVELSGIDCAYELYQEKYKLPSLIYKQRIEKEYIENNPNYDPQYFYEGANKEQLRLPDAFSDNNSSKITDGRIYQKISDKSKVALLPQSPIVIIKDSLVIIFEHLKNQFETAIYSLERNKDLKNYFKTEEGKNKEIYIYKYVHTNSLNRIIQLCSSYNIIVKYMSLQYYNEILKKNDKSQKQQVEEEKKRQEKDKTLKNI